MTEITFPSVIPDLPEADYHAHPALGSSMLKRMDKYAPAKAVVPFAGNPASDLGSLFHLCIADGRTQGRVAVVKDARTKEGKAAKLEALGQGMIVINERTHDQLRGMIDACRAHPFVRDVLENESFAEEISAFAEIGRTPAKCRLDLLTSAGTVIDWKTARDASERGFERAVAEYGYGIQEAHYRNVWLTASGNPITDFNFVAIESEPPYLTGVYRIHASWYTEGVARWNQAMARYRVCVMANNFPGLPDHPVDLIGPNWDFKLTERDASGLSGAR